MEHWVRLPKHGWVNLAVAYRIKVVPNAVGGPTATIWYSAAAGSNYVVLKEADDVAALSAALEALGAS